MIPTRKPSGQDKHSMKYYQKRLIHEWRFQSTENSNVFLIGKYQQLSNLVILRALGFRQNKLSQRTPLLQEKSQRKGLQKLYALKTPRQLLILILKVQLTMTRIEAIVRQHFKTLLTFYLQVRVFSFKALGPNLQRNL